MLSRKPAYGLPRTVGAAVIHEYDLVVPAFADRHLLYPADEFGERLLLVQKRYDYAYVLTFLHLLLVLEWILCRDVCRKNGGEYPAVDEAVEQD